MLTLLNNIYFLATEASKNPDDEIFGKVAIGIAVGIFFLPIFVLTMIVCIRSIIRGIKKSKAKPSENVESKQDEYLKLFGGKENIESIHKEMTRVAIVVKNLELVNTENLKNLGFGILIVGNTVKCSSKELAEILDEFN